MRIKPHGRAARTTERDLRTAGTSAIYTAEGSPDSTNVLDTAQDTVGVLYLDSRMTQADLSAGNRELLQTLALEASTILENARLLEEDRKRGKLDEEMKIARGIQQEPAAANSADGLVVSSLRLQLAGRAGGRRLLRRACGG